MKDGLLGLIRLDAFSLDYCPERLLYRSEYVKQLLDHDGPLVLHGKPGTGKTVTAKWISKQKNAVYVEGRQTLIASLQAALNTREDNLDRLFEFLMRSGKPVFFDDVQRMSIPKAKFNDSLFYIAEKFVERPFTLVTNMEPFAFKRLVSEENDRRIYRYPNSTLVLSPYGADQMLEIITSRIREAQVQDLVEPAAIKYLAGMAKNSGYSLSRVFSMLRYWLEHDAKVTEDLVHAEFERAAIEDWKKQLGNMDRHSAMFLAAAATCNLKEGDDPSEGVTMGEVYREYCKLAKAFQLYARRLDVMSHAREQLTREGLLESSEPQILPGGGHSSLIRVSNRNPEVIVKAAQELYLS